MIKNHSKIVALLGFSRKAGKICSGDTAVLAAVKYRKAKLVLIAADAAQNTRNKIAELCNSLNIRVIEFATKDELGHITGAASRAAIAINDNEFSKAIIKLHDEQSEVSQ